MDSLLAQFVDRQADQRSRPPNLGFILLQFIHTILPQVQIIRFRSGRSVHQIRQIESADEHEQGSADLTMRCTSNLTATFGCFAH